MAHWTVSNNPLLIFMSSPLQILISATIHTHTMRGEFCCPTEKLYLHLHKQFLCFCTDSTRAEKQEQHSRACRGSLPLSAQSNQAFIPAHNLSWPLRTSGGTVLTCAQSSRAAPPAQYLFLLLPQTPAILSPNYPASIYHVCPFSFHHPMTRPPIPECAPLYH